MNVLAPVADRGKLRPAISDGVVLGFSTGEFRVSDPESRKRAMHDRVGGPTCPLLTLEDVRNARVDEPEAVNRPRATRCGSQ